MYFLRSGWKRRMTMNVSAKTRRRRRSIPGSCCGLLNSVKLVNSSLVVGRSLIRLSLFASRPSSLVLLVLRAARYSLIAVRAIKELPGSRDTGEATGGSIAGFTTGS